MTDRKILLGHPFDNLGSWVAISNGFAPDTNAGIPKDVLASLYPEEARSGPAAPQVEDLITSLIFLSCQAELHEDFDLLFERIRESFSGGRNSTQRVFSEISFKFPKLFQGFYKDTGSGNVRKIQGQKLDRCALRVSSKMQSFYYVLASSYSLAAFHEVDSSSVSVKALRAAKTLVAHWENYKRFEPLMNDGFPLEDNPRLRVSAHS